MKKTRYSAKLLLVITFLFMTGTNLSAQSSHRVLFLGNSYTGVNNLPQIISDIALSVGDTLNYESNTPGGYQLIDHSLSPPSQSKIAIGGWDYIVLQGQSQEPITNHNVFANGYSNLFQLIRQSNPCATIMPYMTWGRKNGDLNNCPSFPVMCTYEGMDSTLRDRYLDFTKYVNGEVSPVSVVWRYLRENHSTIELYQSDQSHPSTAGSYAAACCFYASIFKKDPSLISYDFGLNATEAAIIRNAAKTIVYDQLNTWDYKKLPIADFRYSTGAGVNKVYFNGINMQNVRQSYFWDFGDNTTSNAQSPSHSYLANGTYTVGLTTTTCNLQGTYTHFKDTVLQFCNHTPTITTANPWLCKEDTLWTEPADSYQWVVSGSVLPETNRYLVNYTQYNISGFAVISTLNGCSELSEMFSKSHHWSGYYFDALGNPCEGDTVKFAVLHTSGFLSGSEIIQWYKNDTLLINMSNEDTLLVTSTGKYECKLIDPISNCPLDTNSYAIEYDCGGTVGIVNRNTDLQTINWRVFPNPVSETLTIEMADWQTSEKVQIYNSTGQLIKTLTVVSSASMDVSDLPIGLYFIRLENHKQSAIKFIKR